MNRTKIFATAIPLLAIFALALGFSPGAQTLKGFTPKEGFVPTAKVAVIIAEAVLTPVYGEQHIAAERPFKALLKGGVWTVEGTLRVRPGDDRSVQLGGVAMVKIAKKDGRIVYMMHGK